MIKKIGRPKLIFGNFLAFSIKCYYICYSIIQLSTFCHLIIFGSNYFSFLARWHLRQQKICKGIIVPTLLRVEELYNHMGFFCSDKFDRPIYSTYRVVSGINKKAPPAWNMELNFFFEFRILQGVIVFWSFVNNRRISVVFIHIFRNFV